MLDGKRHGFPGRDLAGLGHLPSHTRAIASALLVGQLAMPVVLELLGRHLAIFLRPRLAANSSLRPGLLMLSLSASSSRISPGLAEGRDQGFQAGHAPLAVGAPLDGQASPAEVPGDQREKHR